MIEASQEQTSLFILCEVPLICLYSSFQSESEIFNSTLQLSHTPTTQCMSLFGLLVYHVMGKSSFKQTTALLSNDPDNDRPSLYLALVSLTDLQLL